MKALAADKAALADFAWLAGQWRGKAEGGDAEQTWTEPAAGVMMGMFRLVKGEQTLVLEFFSLRETNDGIEFRIRHFSPALDPWEKGDPIILKLRRHEGDRAVFENPVNNSPKWSYLTRTGKDSYTGRSEIIRDTGEIRVIEVAMQRVNPEGAVQANVDAEASAEEADPLSPLAWLAGGKWVAEVERPDGGKLIRESIFEWAPNKKAMRFWSFVQGPEGQRTPYVEGMYGWHPGKKQLVFWYFDSPGTYYEGVVKVDGNKLDHEFKGVNATGQTRKWRYWLIQESQDRMPIKIFSFQDGEWSEIVNLVYERRD